MSSLGRYRLVSLIARGGMGEVFRAEAVGADGFNKPVVVKRVLPRFEGDARFTELFAEEAKLMTRILHPNIVQVHDFGRGDDGAYFLVMELVDGVDAGRFRREQPDTRLASDLALFIAHQLLRGLAHAHDEGLVHRDVSPENVLLSRLGEVKLADFGVATREPGADVRVGKLRYMSPEQHAGGVVDARADLYSLAVMLVELLTGELPFEITHAPHGKPKLTGNPPLDEWLQPLLSASRDDRPTSARAVAKSLRGLRHVGVAIADADDLAAAVASVSLTPDKPIVRLAAPPGAAAPTRVTCVGGSGSFTIDAELMSAGPPAITEGRSGDTRESAEPDADRHDLTEREPERLTPDRHESEAEAIAKPRVSVVLALVLVGVGLLGVALPVGWWLASSDPSPPGASTHVPAPATPTPANDMSKPNDTAPSADAGHADTTRTFPSADSHPNAPSSPTPDPNPASVAPKGPAPPSPSLPPTSPPPPPTTTPPPPTTTPPPPTTTPQACTGTLRIVSDGSWTIVGGPETVQSPIQRTWPCATYSLVATSRLDPSQQRQRTVTVRDDRPAVVDLR